MSQELIWPGGGLLVGVGLQAPSRAIIVTMTALPRLWQSFETVREGVRAGAHLDSPTRLCGAWAGPRAMYNMNMVRPWVPICAYPKLLNPQVEPWVLADCRGTETSGLLSLLHARQLLTVKLRLISC